ncbi:unnamed protein product [Paramecium sonneborni]|uniref:Uncharacterized protein n=1 Tax=Paramecium sonneborni TaxID=65129 RepID=A0A8S1QWL3_9CILI|nr:unnamed protein product [Paramecium sonneborni]
MTSNNFTITNYIFNGYSETDQYILQLSNCNITINNHNVTLNKSGFFQDNSQSQQISLYQNMVGTKYLNEELSLRLSQNGYSLQSFINENFASHYQNIINLQKAQNSKSELTAKILKQKEVNRKKYTLSIRLD